MVVDLQTYSNHHAVQNQTDLSLWTTDSTDSRTEKQWKSQQLPKTTMQLSVYKSLHDFSQRLGVARSGSLDGVRGAARSRTSDCDQRRA